MSTVKFTAEELAAFRQEYAAEATDSQFNLFIAECERRGLRPGAHLVFQLRNSKQWDATVGAAVYVKKPYWITTIAALLLIAERTGKYDGASAPEYIYLDDSGDPTVLSEIPLPHKENKQIPREPWAVRVKIRRKDFSEPIVSVVRFDSVATRKKDNTVVLTDMWQKRGPEQNAKCSLANGIRIGFPEEASQLYLSEEVKNETDDPIAVTPASVVPLPPAVPKVDHTPAVGTDAPRPGEQKPTEAQKEVIREVLPKIEEVIKNPEVKNALADSGKKVNQEEIDRLKKEVGLTAASELSTPKKRGPKPKVKSPDNGQPPVEGITEEDIASANTPAPPEITEADRKTGADFVESVDPTPTTDEQKSFTARVRALAALGTQNADLKNYILNVGKQSDPKKLTVGNWTQALGELEALDKDKLKEVTKNAPLPAF